MKLTFIGFWFVAVLARTLCAAELPNVLWIVSEDNGAEWLGCYGNAQASTPRLDTLAKEGIRFSRAYSNGPVCAVARSTILNGAHAVTQGTQHMRSRHRIPEIYRSYVSYLREAGYYCTNAAKTDYNFEGDDKAIWDECSKQATYQHRPEGKPFFSVFNIGVTHEGQLFKEGLASNRKRGVIPKTPRIEVGKVVLPPYLPDLPEIRSDMAIYHDLVTAMDTEVGKLLDQLKEAGLADDTIVIYTSDHGGAMPRGKRYLEDSGVRVPMLIHVPEKWRGLSPFPAGRVVDEVVGFVDMAPTFLSLAGLDTPAQMQGRAFLGPRRREPAKDAVAFLYADRFDEAVGMRRGITDGKWKYIRCFTPYLPGAPYSNYLFGQAGWTAWQKAWQDGKLAEPFRAIWESPQPVERLFDLSADPNELRNLAGDAAFSGRLAEMRERLKTEMIGRRDLGIIPEPMFSELSPGKAIADYYKGRESEIPALVSLAFAASAGDVADLPRFLSGMDSEDPVTRYWAVQGCLMLGKKSAEPARSGLTKLLGDTSAPVRIGSANALAMLGEKDTACEALVTELEKGGDELAQIQAICVLSNLGELDRIPDDWVKRTLANKQAEDIKRPALRIAEERKIGK